MLQNALINSFAQHFANGLGFSTIEKARQHAALVLGKPVYPGTATAKQVDEAIEAGVIKASRQLVKQAATPSEAYLILVALHHNQHPITVRSSTSVMNQAYSTPVPISFMALHLGGIQADTSVYEPCGGNGSLLIDVAPAKATVNELDPVRAKTLTAQGFTVTEHDATRYVPRHLHDVVIANPPFGTISNGAGGNHLLKVPVNGDILHSTRIEQVIVFNSLMAMKPNGRAVFILDSEQRGQARRAKHYSSGQNQKFFELLYRHYNVTNHFTLSRKLYRKQGADVPVDIIVIEGKGRSNKPLPKDQIPPIYNSFNELGELIRPIRTATATNLSRPVASVAEAETILRQGGSLKTADGLLEIDSRDGDQSFVLKTPLKTQTGGQYFLNPDLLKAIEGDFYSIKDQMQSTIPAHRLEPTLRILFQKSPRLLAGDTSSVRPNIIGPIGLKKSLKELREWYASVNDIPLTKELSGYAAINTARHLLDISGIERDQSGQRSLEGKRYRIDESPSALIIHATHRCIVVSLQDGKLTTNLTTKDIARFSLLSERLGDLLQQHKSIKLPTVSTANRAIASVSR